MDLLRTRFPAYRKKRQSRKSHAARVHASLRSASKSTRKVGAMSTRSGAGRRVERSSLKTARGRVFTRARQTTRRPNIVPLPSPDGDKDGSPRLVGVKVDGEIKRGLSTPSRRLEFYSPTMAQWGWPEYAIPTYIKSHVHARATLAGRSKLF